MSDIRPLTEEQLIGALRRLDRAPARPAPEFEERLYQVTHAEALRRWRPNLYLIAVAALLVTALIGASVVGSQLTRSEPEATLPVVAEPTLPVVAQPTLPAVPEPTLPAVAPSQPVAAAVGSPPSESTPAAYGIIVVGTWGAQLDAVDLLGHSWPIWFGPGDLTSLSWAPDGRRLAVGTAGGIRLLKVIPDSPGWTAVDSRWIVRCHESCEAAWSPDGSQLAVAGDSQLRLVDPALTQPSVVLLTRSGIGDPTWSPDGKRIAFDVVDSELPSVSEPVSSIYAINSDGTGLQELIAPAPGSVGAQHAAWSPGGSTLAYIGSAVPALGSLQGTDQFLQLDLLNLVDGSVRQVADVGTCLRNSWTGVTWSPDGANLAVKEPSPGQPDPCDDRPELVDPITGETSWLASGWGSELAGPLAWQPAQGEATP